MSLKPEPDEDIEEGHKCVFGEHPQFGPMPCEVCGDQPPEDKNE